jgi:hypothetical protein
MLDARGPLPHPALRRYSERARLHRNLCSFIRLVTRCGVPDGFARLSGAVSSEQRGALELLASTGRVTKQLLAGSLGVRTYEPPLIAGEN